MTPRSRAVAPALVALLVPPVFADEAPGPGEIAELRKEVVELRKEVAALKAARAPESDPSAVRAAVDDYLAHVGPTRSPGLYAGPGGVRRPGGGVTLG